MSIAHSFFGSFTFDLFAAMCCIAFNAMFVIAEYSLVRVRPSRIQELIGAGNKRAQIVSRMLEDLDGYLSATQLGITIMSLGLGWIGEPALAELIKPLIPVEIVYSEVIAHTIAVILAFFTITYLHIVIGELVPRSMALRNAERLALLMAPMLLVFRNVISPLLIIFDRSARAISKLFGGRVGYRAKDKFSDEELRLVLIDNLGKGAISDTKLDLIDNVFDFSRRTAKHAMVSRDAIVSLDLTAPIEPNLARAKQNNHTRYPLCEGTIDQIVGLVNFKDVLWESEASRDHMDLRKIRREILFVPESRPLTKLLKDFQRNKIHMAIVIDEFGLTVGLVTLEDVLEELVGEIQDEYDQEVSRIQLMRDGSYYIEGSTLIEEVEEKLGIKIDKGDNTTIAGAVLTRLGRLPRVGDTADFENFTFLVKSLKGRRIAAVQAIKKAAPHELKEEEKKIE